MTEHLPGQLIRRYRARTLQPGDRETIYRHLKVCEHCQRQLMTPEELSATVRAFSKMLEEAEREARADHPEMVRLRAYAGNTLRPIEHRIVEGHLELCPACARRVDELMSRGPALTVQIIWERLTSLAKLDGQAAWRLLHPAMLAAAATIIFVVVPLLIVLRQQGEPDRQTRLTPPSPASTISAHKTSSLNGVTEGASPTPAEQNVPESVTAALSNHLARANGRAASGKRSSAQAGSRPPQTEVADGRGPASTDGTRADYVWVYGV